MILDPTKPPPDPLAAVTHRDPYRYYRELARQQPFHRDAMLMLWVAAGPAEVAAVLSHPACRVRPPGQPVPPPLAQSPAGTLFARLIRMNDGQRHAPLKAVLQRQLATLDGDDVRAAASASARLLPVTDDHAATANRWASALPVIAIARLLGFTATDDDVTASRIAAQIGSFAAAMSPLAGPAEINAGIDAAASLQTLPLRADTPWAKALCAEARAAGVDDDAIAANLLGLMVQGCEATAGLIGNTLLWLAGDAAGAEDPSTTVAKVLRSDPPIHNTRRFMAEDALVCGVPLRRGDGILVLLAAAAASELEVENVSANTPTLAKRGERAGTFGHGAHRCPGDAVAAALAEASVSALLARGIEPAALARAYRYRPSLNARIPHFL
ncbi:cytochrome P450 [Cupriavidus sp. HPC(L)]|uniref:cytochrome P450 n=1 Tax=Cupriavidus sp. HPC(L) TaxID=1217418 RepID=UPI0003BF23CD|nr:cytochrome P450 [Cupriavidus sp. HPC(L)]ESJ19541.1 cytochrome P450 [Cupriavidus sp. HPC(L)]